MPVDVIVLNGGSSSGKTSISEHVQRGLAGTWLVLGVDDLIRALSFGRRDTSAGGTLEFAADGTITVSDRFRRAESAWRDGIAAMATAGVGVILDEVLLDGGDSQARLLQSIGGLTVAWIGVRCDPDVAEARERQRGDRVRGMARDQAQRVHQGVSYDYVVDSSHRTPAACAADIVTYVTSQFR